MRFAIVIAIALSLVGCRKFDEDAIQNLNNGKIDIIGHGGSGFQSASNPYFINSRLSVIMALEAVYADGVEVDVQMSIDSVLFLFHDEQLDNKTTCHGCIASYTAAEVAQCPYYQGIDDVDGDLEQIVTLEEMLERYSQFENPPAFFLDTKSANFCVDGFVTDLSAMAFQLNALLAKYDAYDWVTVESRSTNLLNKVRALSPNIKLMFDVDDIPSGVDAALTYGYQGVAASNAKVSKEDVTLAHAAGLIVHIFSVRSRAGHLDAMNKWPDAVQSDNIELMQNMLLN
jgi:glycerophosphoryl diester phosphodiesterase